MTTDAKTAIATAAGTATASAPTTTAAETTKGSRGGKGEGVSTKKYGKTGKEDVRWQYNWNNSRGGD